MNQTTTFDKLCNYSAACLANWQGKTIVVKYGGNAMISAELKQTVMQNILLLNQYGINVVLVHGGGPEISLGMKLLGKEPQFINGLRVTDQDTIDVVLQMLAGKVNKRLVALLKGKGIGLCGIDGGLIQCEKLEAELDYGLVGNIVQVDITVLQMALAANLIPVIAAVAVDQQGIIYNVNADTVASEIAVALGADKLVLMTDIAGLLADRNDERSLMSRVEVSQVETLIAQGIISDGMIPKVASCTRFINAGGIEAHIIDGRIKHAILLSILSDKQNGTRFYKEK
ncbi:acetylglutamate kinase [[Haemophilus] ducreyi]|uniref:Acetylglutamate kinase n=2 Tax=Haemophilus ducreyi TaxID=730 RepID=ARGB_HAEDU|nr:acetylglutamate kinase [[Haemophilus] ducreyi]Q7VMS6.1 RecName: Full=Acetylglutamate kinase; AltName: Full=N-acetyl-L-glutamate 5-phosphotransferase; AltName: Full=NAG kinase; Short=NAGK [[Haemophilus] ducreyi 35000HP]AAP95777.1 acetylglutamate kinase [[Haemophilus] ducreyi 35000HP]AKO30827.1 acetylglutamate kinase [[Haemophilus] ducreyi]AKO32265.1 acetylglutamate kinase [[Haemophilus] ducreyi]AKO33719.1 acetylglutamate kinase [[Haemophilus] ducreyi]AKO35166.1 acetylglutamate kinase [[Haem